jgi:mRNA interferase RelE/StbE
MPNKILIRTRAEKFLKNLTDLKLRLRLQTAIDRLCEDARPASSAKLISDGEIYRLRVGDYRIVYEIFCEEIVVSDIGHRREIFRNF